MPCGDFESEIGNGLKAGIVGLIIGGIWFLLSDEPKAAPRKTAAAPKAAAAAAKAAAPKAAAPKLTRLTGEGAGI